jgi:hypothetical protein
MPPPSCDSIRDAIESFGVVPGEYTITSRPWTGALYHNFQIRYRQGSRTVGMRITVRKRLDVDRIVRVLGQRLERYGLLLGDRFGTFRQAASSLERRQPWTGVSVLRVQPFEHPLVEEDQAVGHASRRTNATRTAWDYVLGEDAFE